MNTLILKTKVFLDGKLIVEKTFDQDVLKVGKLPSSHLVLDKIARMHAVIERVEDVHAKTTTFRIIDLGSSVGTQLNNEVVARSEVLPPTGKLDFGPWSVVYEIIPDPKTPIEHLKEMRERLGAKNRAREMNTEEWEAEARRMDKFDRKVPRRQDDDNHLNVVDLLTGGAVKDPERKQDYDDDGKHHLEMFKSLSKAYADVSNDEETLSTLGRTERTWGMMTTERKRGLLRALVKDIRDLRGERKEWDNRRIATMLNMGPDFVKKAFALSPEEALEKAVEAAMQLTAAKASLKFLQIANIKETVLSSETAEKDKAQLECFARGYDLVEEHLKNILVGGLSSFIVLTSRAGGHELSEEDEKEMEEEWLKAVEKSNLPTPE